MTVLDAANHLYEWFGSNDSFEMNRDLKKILPIIDHEEETLSAFKLALLDLENNTMIASQEWGDKKYYILNKPYDAYNQNIELTAFTSKWLAGEINEFCGLIEDKTDLCTASAVSDKDIRNLIHIIQFYKQKTTEKEEIISNFHAIGNPDIMEEFESSGGQKILQGLLDAGYDDSKKEDKDKDEGEDEDGKKKKGKKKK